MAENSAETKNVNGKPLSVKSEEKKSVKTKVVNLTGKKVKTNALVMKAKKSSGVKVKDIKKLNEEVARKKLEAKDVTRETLTVNREDATEKKEKVLEDKKYKLTVDLKDLLAAGCHLGHKVSKTNPRAKDNLYGVRDGVQIFDLVKTLDGLEKACNYIYNLTRNGKRIILVGTKRQTREVIKRVAEEAGVGYITDRWLGGTISNWEQISKNIKKLKDLKEGLAQNKFTENTKKEKLDMAKEVIRLEKIVGGLISLDSLFDAIFVVDAGLEKTAIKEASGRKIKTIALVDSDADPTKVDFPITANDDSVKSINLVVEEVGKAIKAAGVKK